jgi:type I restriction enzyme S subunit
VNREKISTNIEWLQQIPANWDICKVKNCFYISKEKAKTDNPVVLKLARDSIQYRDVSNNEGQIAKSYFDYNPVIKGDLLINPMDLYSGANCNVSEIEGVISPAYINLRAIKELEPKYFDYYFKYQYWTMAMFAHGKGVSFDNRWTINSESMLNYEIPFPPYKLQKIIVNKLNNELEKVDKLIKNQKLQIDKLKSYKLSMISEIVTRGLNMKKVLKDTGLTWVDKIPHDWEIMPFKVAFSLNKGISITKSDLKDTGIPVINYGEIHSKYGFEFNPTDNDLKCIEYNLFENSNSNASLSKGDFVFCDTSEDLEGSGNFTILNSNQTVAAGYHTIVAKPQKVCNSRYLAYLFTSDYWRIQIRSKVYGIKLFSITQTILKSTTIILPPLPEQDHISSYLDEKTKRINRIIQIKNSKIEELNEYKKSIIYEYISGKKEVS